MKNKSKMSWIELIGDAILMGAGASYIYIFFSIFFTGGYMAIESRPWILYSEMAMGIVIFAIGINRFIRDLKNE